MKQNLQEEIERINELINETSLGQKIKLNPLNFATKYRPEFVRYFNNVAAYVMKTNQDGSRFFCSNKKSVMKYAVTSLDSLIKKMAAETNMTPQDIVERITEMADSGLTDKLIEIAKGHIPKWNQVPAENMFAVFQYLESKYPSSARKLISLICDISNRLNQPVVYFCGEDPSINVETYCSNLLSSAVPKELGDPEEPTNTTEPAERQPPPQKIQPKEAPQLTTNTAKPNLKTQPTLAQQTEKNRPLQNVASKVKNIAGKVKDKIQNLRGDREGTA
jgi:hypothetical protein